MIRVLLVDDEFLVCNFLRTLLTWEDYGFTVVGQAGNGAEALEKIEALGIQVAFIDVSMPIMDGIALSRALCARYPAIKTVMLSSYSDYDYVRETMRLGAVDYLLKHRLDKDCLAALLKGLAGQVAPAKPAAAGAVPEPPPGILRDSRTRSFFEGGQAELPPALIHTARPVLCAARIRLTPGGQPDADAGRDLWRQGESELRRQERLMHGLLDTCAQVSHADPGTRVVYMGNYSIAFVFGARPGEFAQDQRQRAGQRMGVVHGAVLKYHNTYIAWQCGERCEDLRTLPGEYRRLCTLLLENDTPVAAPVRCQLTIEQERRMILSVMGCNPAQLHEVLNEIFTAPACHEAGEAGLSLLAGDLMTLCVKLCKESGCSLSLPGGGELLPPGLEELHAYFEELFVTLVQEIHSQKGYSPQVTAMIAYVRARFTTNIGLSEVAAHCGLNPSYTSTLFKKETGMNLVQFINRTRIYFAGKRMLMEGIAPTRVFELAGFNNYNNFFNLFKSVTGMSPTQFAREEKADWIARFDPLAPSAGF